MRGGILCVAVYIPGEDILNRNMRNANSNTTIKTINALRDLGSRLINFFYMTGYSLILLGDSIYYFKNIFTQRKEIAKQMYFAGVKSLFVVSVVALFTGMILSLQAGIELRDRKSVV